MFKVRKTLPRADQIEIVPLGDLHNGSPNCRFEKFLKYVDYIRDTKNCYTIAMGDMIDAILPSDKRYNAMDSYTSVDTLKKEVLDALRPIEHKILGMITGNHEIKLARAGYGDPTHYLCQELKVPYMGLSGFIRLHCEPKTHCKDLIIYAHHGWVAGRKTGSAINSIEGLAQHWDADVYLVGHSHKLWATRQIRIGWKGQSKKLFANTGTFLETASMGTLGYGEQAGFPPLKLGCIKVKWYPLTEDIYASE